MQLYEIPNLHRQALDSIQVDEETGVISIPEEFRFFQEEGEKAILNGGRYVRELDDDLERISSEIKRLQTRKKSIDARVKRIKDLMMQAVVCMGKKKIADATLTVSIRKNAPSVVIDEDVVLPEEFLLPPKPREPDKKKLKEELANGVVIDGVSLERSESISIR